jgi:hypothetical protein
MESMPMLGLRPFSISRPVIVLLVSFILLTSAGRAGAILCATDDAPAASLLFPFLQGSYSPASTASVPIADRTREHTVFSITNVSSTTKIVHLVLWNDFGYPLLGWDALFDGYQTIRYDFADLMEGKLVATGAAGAVSPKAPGPAQGPIGSYFTDVVKMPAAKESGKVPGAADTIYGRCTDPLATPVSALSPDANSAGPALTGNVYLGLRKSQFISENAWWGNSAPYYVLPDWLAARNTDEPVWAYVTADVVTACGGGGPWEGPAYFGTYALPVTSAWYRNDPSTGLHVALGNTLLGEWMTRDDAVFVKEAGRAVAVEVDNQDVTNAGSYPLALRDGATFYRYGGPGCSPGDFDWEMEKCKDIYTGSGIGVDFVKGAAYAFGPWNGPLPTGDFREPLPSTFAFQWMYRQDGPGSPGVETKIRIWKEAPDVYPYSGYTYIYSAYQYAYFTWDDDGRIYVSNVICPVCTCPTVPGEINQLPMAVQEVGVDAFLLPDSYKSSGWAAISFMGANGQFVPVPGGYSDPAFATDGSQVMVDVVYASGDGTRSVVRAAPLGNYLCNQLRVSSCPRTGANCTDQGDALY